MTVSASYGKRPLPIPGGRVMSNSSSVPRPDGSSEADDQARANDALELMQQALQLLDDNDGPHDAGADLASAIDRLERWLAR